MIYVFYFHLELVFEYIYRCFQILRNQSSVHPSHVLNIFIFFKYTKFNVYNIVYVMNAVILGYEHKYYIFLMS